MLTVFFVSLGIRKALLERLPVAIRVVFSRLQRVGSRAFKRQILLLHGP